MKDLNASKNELIKLLLDENEAIKSKLIQYKNTIDPKTFRERRKALKLSMKTICDYIGVSESTLSNLENGTSDAYFSTVISIEEYIKKEEIKQFNK